MPERPVSAASKSGRHARAAGERSEQERETTGLTARAITHQGGLLAAVPGCSEEDFARVAMLLGREPAGDFEVVVRDGSDGPAVIRNAPILGDGRPMPTRYWLVDERLRRLVGRLESEGGVRAAEEAVDAQELAAAHARYAAERDVAIPEGHLGPKPSAGVGGTRRGVKCLHAHYAWHLAGGDDPVGRWVAERLGPGAAASLRRME